MDKRVNVIAVLLLIVFVAAVTLSGCANQAKKNAKDAPQTPEEVKEAMRQGGGDKPNVPSQGAGAGSGGGAEDSDDDEDSDE